MASIEKRGKSFRVIFRYDGQRYTRSLHTRLEKVAISSLLRLEDNLRRVELGTQEVPEEVDPADFLLSDGKQSPQKAKCEKQLEKHLSGRGCASWWLVLCQTCS
ncbi:MAG: DUF3596 domain-containing protein [Planctomycetota bacterium]